jgi:hypothetical protein
VFPHHYFHLFHCFLFTFRRIMLARFTLYAAAALSCAALANAWTVHDESGNNLATSSGCFVTPDENGIVTADQITAKFAELGVPDTRMPHQAFWNCGTLISVTLPDTITHLDKWDGGNSFTFAKCSNLVTVTLPASLVVISKDTFWKDTSLANICGATSYDTDVPTPSIFAACPLPEDDFKAMMTLPCGGTVPLCSLTCGVENEMVKVTHDTTSSHTQHRCYLSDFNDLDSCICSCCDGASNDCDEDSNWEF